MNFDKIFWEGLENLLRTQSIRIDRPRGKPHPRHPDLIYPLDYGYLENTTSGDGSGIDVWIGSSDIKTLTGILCTFDKIKRDAEIKLLIGCKPEEMEIIRNFHNPMLTLIIPNPSVKQ